MTIKDWLLLLCISSLTASANGNAASHELTWSGYRGYFYDSTADPEGAVFSIDGEKLRQVAAFKKLEQIDWKQGDRLAIKIPDIVEMDRLQFIFLGPVIGSLLKKNVPVTYFYRDEVCDVRSLWYIRPESDAWNVENTEFFLDGKSLGKGKAALQKLSSIKWGKWPRLHVMLFRGGTYPFQDRGGIAIADYPDDQTLQKLREAGVIVETIREEPFH